jgi:hypothetical protein
MRSFGHIHPHPTRQTLRYHAQAITTAVTTATIPQIPIPTLDGKTPAFNLLLPLPTAPVPAAAAPSSCCTTPRAWHSSAEASLQKRQKQSQLQQTTPQTPPPTPHGYGDVLTHHLERTRQRA